jgi:hypothetical protein
METWLWQGILTSVLAAVLWLGGATALTWVKRKWPKYGDLALYWIAIAACMAVIWFAVSGHALFSWPQPQVTPENIEANVRHWSEDLGLAYTRGTAPDSYFAYSLTTRTGTSIQVFRSVKDKPAFLQFGSQLTMSPEHQAMMATLTKEQVDTVVQEIALELDRTRVGFTIATLSTPQTSTPVKQTVIVLQKATPITNLDEASFAAAADDIEFTVQLVRATTSLALRRARTNRSPH